MKIIIFLILPFIMWKIQLNITEIMYIYQKFKPRQILTEIITILQMEIIILGLGDRIWIKPNIDLINIIYFLLCYEFFITNLRIMME
jgi:hypothetical protein